MKDIKRNSIIAGALAGVAGGLVMMMMRQKIVPKIMPQQLQPDEFVPQEAVEWAEAQVGRPQALSDDQEMKAGAGVHLGYSALMGTIFGMARPQLQGVPAPLMGAAFGLGVWALSFQGWMPALGIIERTTDKPPQKWFVPIMGHIVYGAVTALAFEGLSGTQQRETSERRASREEPVAAYTERTTVINGIRMRWLEHGEGQPVVLVHGIPTSPELWRKVIPRLKDARVLAWEMVGYGKSIPEGRGRDISVAQQAEYLAAWMNHLGIKQALLGGHDLGGGVVQNVAVRHPELCAGLFLTNGVGYDSWPIPMVKAVRAMGDVVEKLPDPAIKPMHKLVFTLGHDDQQVASASMPVHWRNYQRHAAAEAFIRQIRSLDVRDTLSIQDALPHLNIPASVVWGAADQFQKVQYGERFARDLGTVLQRIEGGKHFTPEDHPMQVSQALNDLIREVWEHADAVGV